MLSFIDILNFYRNIKGRYDLLCFLVKWDSDYRKDLIVTALAFSLLFYSIATWDSSWDTLALGIEAGIIMVQLGTELSILPRDYRPSYGGVRYTVQNSTHIAYDELSFMMAGVVPAKAEEKIGFHNPFLQAPLGRESMLASDEVDDAVILRKEIPYEIDPGEINFIHSRHQIRYIACRVADKKQHTTNGVKLALSCTAETLLGDARAIVRKSYYYDALLTAEAFRSRIFRNNIDGEKEVFTDLTTYFPIIKETAGDSDYIRFMPDFYNKVSGHIGITSLLLTENNRIAMMYQGSTKAIGGHTVVLGGSGSMDYADLERAGNPSDLRLAIRHAMSREVCEETGMQKHFAEVYQNTRLTGFFRWIDRSGKPEFVGITKSGGLPFWAQKSIDGDEVVKFEEMPVTITSMDDFITALEYIRSHQINLSLSSLAALRRMTVITGYKGDNATPGQKRIYQDINNFLFG